MTQDTIGFSIERLNILETYIQDKYIDSNKLSGTVLGILKDDKIVYVSILGKSDIENNIIMKRDNIFRIYSMTKPITSVALMMLYEKGFFQLNDPVSDFIPSFYDMNVYLSGRYNHYKTSKTERGITFRDLLSHQSGLTYGRNGTEIDAAYKQLAINRNQFEKREMGTLEDMIKVLSDIPLEFQPGSRWNYSLSTDVCGYLVELISGKSLDLFFQKEIFDPLGMHDTGFFVPTNKLHRFTSNYEFSKSRALNLIDSAKQGSYITKPSFLSGGGGLVSTLDDYLIFCKMILGRGILNDNQLLSHKTIDLMTSNHLPDNSDLAEKAHGRWSETTYSGVGFGLGFSVVLDPVKSQISGSRGEIAWGGAASTAFWIDKKENMSVVFLTQLMPSSTYNIRRELRTLIYSSMRP
jgi:CubicO group peptidase (beta-lactamase class C family)